MLTRRKKVKSLTNKDLIDSIPPNKTVHSVIAGDGWKIRYKAKSSIGRLQVIAWVCFFGSDGQLALIPAWHSGLGKVKSGLPEGFIDYEYSDQPTNVYNDKALEALPGFANPLNPFEQVEVARPMRDGDGAIQSVLKTLGVKAR